MDDRRVGSLFRAIRIRLGRRQDDIAKPARVTRSFISLVERGHLDRVSLGTLRRVGAVLEIQIDIVAHWRGGEVERLLNARHSALHELVARSFRDLPGWESAPEVSFSIYGERGIIDIVCWHAATCTLLVIELKTDIVDAQELVGTIDRKQRLASQVARERGWVAAAVSRWVIVSPSRTTAAGSMAMKRSSGLPFRPTAARCAVG